jgi:hypothetical protein
MFASFCSPPTWLDLNYSIYQLLHGHRAITILPKNDEKRIPYSPLFSNDFILAGQCFCLSQKYHAQICICMILDLREQTAYKSTSIPQYFISPRSTLHIFNPFWNRTHNRCMLPSLSVENHTNSEKVSLFLSSSKVYQEDLHDFCSDFCARGMRINHPGLQWKSYIIRWNGMAVRFSKTQNACGMFASVS